MVLENILLVEPLLALYSDFTFTVRPNQNQPVLEKAKSFVTNDTLFLSDIGGKFHYTNTNHLSVKNEGLPLFAVDLSAGLNPNAMLVLPYEDFVACFENACNYHASKGTPALDVYQYFLKELTNIIVNCSLSERLLMILAASKTSTKDKFIMTLLSTTVSLIDAAIPDDYKNWVHLILTYCLKELEDLDRVYKNGSY